MRIPSLILWFLFLLPALAFSQNASVKGVLQDSETRSPLIDAEVSLVGSSTLTTHSSSTGVFEFKNVPFGKYSLEILVEGYDKTTQEVEVNSSVVDLGPVSATHSENLQSNLQDNLPSLSLSESDARENSSQSVAGALGAARDPFASAAAFNFSAGRFRNRGYDNENSTLLNGIPAEDLSNSRTLFGAWAGLNDVTRSREATFGLNPSNYTYGSLDGSLSIDARASKQRKQFSLSYAKSNRTYSNRLMASFGSGLLSGGWAFSASISRRWGDEVYVPGTFTDGWSWYGSLEKRFGNNHSLSLTHMGANTLNGRANPAIQEAYDLAGSNYYNPNWGYQNGKVRNARHARQQQPLTVLSHEWKLSPKSELETSIGYQYGMTSLSGFDWFNATDPRPDYYRRLPSYITDPDLKAQATYLWQNDENYRQVDWENIYNVNLNSNETVYDAGGIIGNNVTGKRSRYIIEERVTENKRLTFALNYNHVVNDHFVLSAGVLAQKQKSENYKRVGDLLGGEFYVDLNQWAEQDFPDSSEALQNNLETPNRILYEGDKFGYYYISTVNKNMGWVQGQFKFNRVDFFAAFHVATTEFYRTGKYRNGIFANTSFGDSKKENFSTYGAKGGVTYKLNGRNYFFVNGAYETRAPLFENVYVSPRTRNDAIQNLVEEKITSIEGGYMLRAPKVKIRSTLYYTQMNDGYNAVNFWHDDFRTFVNYTLSNIDRRHVGLEFGTDITLGQGWSTTFATAIGQYYYTDRMKATITQDNNATVLAEDETIYSKNFFFANGPQHAGMIGVSYRSKKFWTLVLSTSYFGNNYTDFNPARRTVSGVELLNNGELRESIIDQQKSDGEFTLDLFGTKSWRVSDIFKGFRRNTFLVFNIGISNILDNQNLVQTGFEQLRFDYAEKNPNKFPPRYYYGLGRNYFAAVIVRFN